LVCDGFAARSGGFLVLWLLRLYDVGFVTERLSKIISNSICDRLSANLEAFGYLVCDGFAARSGGFLVLCQLRLYNVWFVTDRLSKVISNSVCNRLSANLEAFGYLVCDGFAARKGELTLLGGLFVFPE
jgi:hypothetical protein